MGRTTRTIGWVCTLMLLAAQASGREAIIVDHADADIAALSEAQLQNAKDKLHIAYGHTSHGSQVTTGMSGLVGFANGGGKGLSLPANFLAWNNGGTGGALDLHDYFVAGDLGNPDRTTWATRTRDYLNDPANADVNVVMWSWCGQADTTAANIDLYLTLMSQLEADYPHVRFVYMTGHTNGCSTTGNLFLRNQQIRNYCTANGKILYDFADIESWDPDGLYYGDKLVNDACQYDSDGNGSLDRNWALDWQNSHTLGVDWYSCSSAHSQALNANRKAYAAWSMFVRIAESLLPRLPGDADEDGDVDLDDFVILKRNFGIASGATWGQGDFDGNGSVTLTDFSILKNNFGAAAP
ncbi:MAG: hypothetical protein GX591_11510 [Planctomycetes bacterium]|nr:hypothetical protein [Planctomycetota bacterium]